MPIPGLMKGPYAAREASSMEELRSPPFWVEVAALSLRAIWRAVSGPSSGWSENIVNTCIQLPRTGRRGRAPPTRGAALETDAICFGGISLDAHGRWTASI
jgi:hypothetical protein